MFAVAQDGSIVEVEAFPVDGGYVIRHPGGCLRQFIEAEKLSKTRAEAVARARQVTLEKGEPT